MSEFMICRCGRPFKQRRHSRVDGVPICEPCFAVEETRAAQLGEVTFADRRRIGAVMSNRMDNLQTVFDRTDWQALRSQKADLLAAMHYAEQLNRPRTLDGLHGLLNWLSAMQAAARMDGYQVEFFEDARDERVDRELDR